MCNRLNVTTEAKPSAQAITRMQRHTPKLPKKLLPIQAMTVKLKSQKPTIQARAAYTNQPVYRNHNHHLRPIHSLRFQHHS